MATIVIIFGDFLGYGGASARSNGIGSNSEDKESNENDGKLNLIWGELLGLIKFWDPPNIS